MLDLDTKTMIDRLVSEEIRNLKTYHVPDSDGLVKLDAMENPYQLSDTLKKAWVDSLIGVEVNRYPDANCTKLKKDLRSIFNIPNNKKIIIGNGSDELIQTVIMLVGGKGRVILSPIPTFSMYKMISISTRSQFIGVPLDNNFCLEPNSLLKSIEKYNPALIFLSYPNNPTGNRFNETVMMDVIKQSRGLVVIDEAYFPFCRRTFMDHLQLYKNVLILRTMSKNGMAGFRVGLLVSHPQWFNALEKIRLPYNIDSITQASMRFYLRHYDILESQSELIIQEREWLRRRMSSISNLITFPSETNFILFRVKSNVNFFFNSLIKKGILIKNLHNPGTSLENCFRVTVGTHRENKVFMTALESIF